MSWQTYTATPQTIEFRKYYDFHCLSSHCKNILSYLFYKLFLLYYHSDKCPSTTLEHCHDWWNLEYHRSARLLCAQYCTPRVYFVYSEFTLRCHCITAAPPCMLMLFSGRRQYLMITRHIPITSLQKRYILLMGSLTC